MHCLSYGFLEAHIYLLCMFCLIHLEDEFNELKKVNNNVGCDFLSCNTEGRTYNVILRGNKLVHAVVPFN